MTITKKEVKTTYTINFTASEFAYILDAWQKSMQKHRHPHAFENLHYDEVNELKLTQVHDYFVNLGLEGNSDTYAFIAEYFGFDGWSNAGYYNEAKKVYTMTVYDNGDTLNKASI